MKETYLSRLLDMSFQAESEVIEPLIEEHKEILFLDEDSDDFWGDGIYTLPIHYEVSRHGFYLEYAITRLGYQDDKPSAYCVEKGEGDDSGWFDLTSLSCEETLGLADYLMEHFGEK